MECARPATSEGEVSGLCCMRKQRRGLPSLAQEESRSGRERGSPMAKRVLVVDDATFIRTMVKNILIPRGFVIAGEASNGVDAVTRYQELKPDLVTMDITMNEKSGLEAAREIMRCDPSARIIIVTALGHEKRLIDSFKIGVKDFVVKPFKPERLITAVEKALA